MTCICCAFAWEELKLLFVNSHHLSNEVVGNSLNDFHSLLRQFLSSIVTSVQIILPFPLYRQKMKLYSLSAGTYQSRMTGEFTDHGSTCINCCSDYLHHYPDGPTALLNFILEMTIFTIKMLIEIDGPSSGGLSDRCSGFHSNSTF